MSDAGKAIFLSYASQDAEAAKKICEALRAAGVEVWFDQNELVGGDAWDQKIRRQIKECALLIPVISANTEARTEGYFRLEWRLADQRTHLMAKGRPFLLPVVIDDTQDAEAQVPDSFLDVQWTKAPGGQVPAAFGERVQRLLAGGTGSRESASRPPVSAGGGRRARPADEVEGAPTSRQGRPRWLVPVLAALALGLIGFAAVYLKPTPAAPAAAGPASGTVEVLRRVEEILAKTDVTRAELDFAADLLRQAAKADPGNALVFTTWVEVDCRYISENYDLSPARRDAAQRHAATAAGLDPRSFAVRFASARVLENLTSRDSAGKVLQAWASLRAEQPHNPRVLLSLVWAAQNAGRPAEAIQWAEELQQIPGWEPPALFNRGLVLTMNRDLAAGLALIGEAAQREPAVKYLLWRAYIETIWLGDAAAARATLAKVPESFFLEDMPASAKFFIEIRARDYDAALATMRAIPRDFVESNAGSFPTAYLRGQALSLAGKTAAADAEWRAALGAVERRLQQDGNDRALLMAKATVLAALGQHDSAGHTWQTVTELYGPSPGNWLSLYYAAHQFSPDELIAWLAGKDKSLFWSTAAELRIDPLFDRVRGDPRFAALLAEAEADPQRSPTAAPIPASRTPAPSHSEARQLAEQAWQLAIASGAEGQGMRSAVEMAEKAIRLDKLDGEVWALAARVDLHAFVMGFDMGDVRQEQIRIKVSQARSLAPRSITGRISEAQMLTKLDPTPATLAEADRLLRELLAESLPDDERSSVLGMQASVLNAQDRFLEAAPLFEAAGWHDSVVWAYLNAGKIPEALASARKWSEQEPDPGWQMVAIVQMAAGDLDAARRAFDQVSITGQKSEIYLSLRLWNAMLRRDWEGALAAARQMPGDFVENLFLAGPRRTQTGWAHHYAGRPEAAKVEWLAALRSVEQRIATDATAERNLWSLWILQTMLGRTSEAERTERLMLQVGNFKAGQAGVFFHAFKRDREATLQAATSQLSPANRKNWNLFVHTALRYDPEFDFLRDDPRFDKLLRETLLPGAKPFDDPKPEVKP